MTFRFKHCEVKVSILIKINRRYADIHFVVEVDYLAAEIPVSKIFEYHVLELCAIKCLRHNVVPAVTIEVSPYGSVRQAHLVCHFCCRNNEVWFCKHKLGVSG